MRHECDDRRKQQGRNARDVGDDERRLCPGLAHGLDSFHTSLRGQPAWVVAREAVMRVFDMLAEFWAVRLVLSVLAVDRAAVGRH